MFVRNRLNSGEYITVVPIGLPVTLQYGETGQIEKVYIGYEIEHDHVSDKLLEKVLELNTVPRKVPLQNGTTWVYGVLYTGEDNCTSGQLPQCTIRRFADMYIDERCPFNFFAASMKTLAGKFQGAIQILQWLKMSGFETLPGATLSSSSYDLDTSLWESFDVYPFRYPLITGYFKNVHGTITYEDTGLSQCTVESVEASTDSVGRISYILKLSDGTLRYVSCQEHIKYNIHPGTVIVFDVGGTVIYSYPREDVIQHSATIYCPTCGRSIKVPEDGPVTCTDAHCISRLYPQVEQFLSAFSLPTISYIRYKEISSPTHGAFAVPDILDCVELNNVRIITSLSKLLRAIIPISAVPAASSIIDSFCTNCNNSIHTIVYYMQNPEAISKDMYIEGVERLQQWFADPVNVSDVKALLEHSKITISVEDKKFDGPPIFRGKKIMITGDFLHGSTEEITAIFSSYSAIVTATFDESVDCIVVGDTQANVNGHSVQYALKHNIPVFTEHSFFAKYEIDQDLANNL